MMKNRFSHNKMVYTTIDNDCTGGMKDEGNWRWR
jgi:hypothetical protein